jgi:hypothetical protein
MTASCRITIKNVFCPMRTGKIYISSCVWRNNLRRCLGYRFLSRLFSGSNSSIGTI